MTTDSEMTLEQREQAQEADECNDLHTPCPSGYIERADWMTEMAKTHKQTRCPNCGLWAVWIPKGRRPWSTAKTYQE